MRRWDFLETLETVVYILAWAFVVFVIIATFKS